MQLADFARPLKRVSESILVDELLRDLRCDRQHFALVVDEHGTAIGFVSLEDILEAIVAHRRVRPRRGRADRVA